MTTTDREDLYETATEAYNTAAEAQAARAPLGSRDTAPWRDGIRSVVDLVLDSHPEPTADGEALAQLVRDVRDGDGHTVQIDGVLIAQCDERGRAEAERIAKLPWDVLREADKMIRGHWNFDGIDSTRLLALADELEAEHRAAQEKADVETAREKLIDEAAQVLHRAGSFGQVREWADLGDDQEFFIVKARALADAGLLAAPETTDGGAA